MKPIQDHLVAKKFEGYPVHIRDKLLHLRSLIFETADEITNTGPIYETLKWGEPSYLTSATKSGSTIRIDWKPKSPDEYAMYFNCKTTLVDTFRTIFPNDFRFEGNRALVFAISDEVPVESLKFCIGAALTYHQAAKSSKA